jgi:hypothetical protein
LFYVERNGDAVAVELDKEGIFVLKIEVSAFKVRGDFDGEVIGSLHFQSGDLSGGSDFTFVEDAGDAVFVSSEALEIVDITGHIEWGSIEVGGGSIEEPKSTSENKNEDGTSDEEGLGIYA